MFTKGSVQLVLFSCVWIVRSLIGGVEDDTKITLGVLIVYFRISIYQCSSLALEYLFESAREHWPFLLLAALSFYGFYKTFFERRHAEELETEPAFPGRLKPLILPCRTAHTRLFPKKHAFSYSYLQVGVPIGWTGSINSVLSSEGGAKPFAKNEAGKRMSKAWFRVEARDHLERSNEDIGLAEKLVRYLLSQREDPNEYHSTYLITAPRFLNYVFNPVSFWYLYSSNQTLSAMILEVNNTFDERRMYFMKPNEPAPNGPNLDADTSSQSLSTTSKFKTKWQKDFHVSPFNSRKGSYSLLASNPISGNINNSITLLSSKNHVKLIARIFSSGPEIDPATLSYFSTYKFILSWSYIGFLTFPRIVFEASRLFFRRKLHVWYRPEVFASSIGRVETGEEAVVARLFMRFLTTCVEECRKSVSMSYVSPKSRTSFGGESTESDEGKLELQILTPQFYSDLLETGDAAVCIAKALKADEERRTIKVTGSAEDLLEVLKHESMQEGDRISLPGRVRWQILRMLQMGEVRKFDEFVRTRCAPSDVSEYRAIVMKRMLRLGGLLPEEVGSCFGLIARVVLCYLSVDIVARSTFMNADVMWDNKSISEIRAISHLWLVAIVWLIKNV